jgi:hypothetical protein
LRERGVGGLFEVWRLWVGEFLGFEVVGRLIDGLPTCTYLWCMYAWDAWLELATLMESVAFSMVTMCDMESEDIVSLPLSVEMSRRWWLMKTKKDEKETLRSLTQRQRALETRKSRTESFPGHQA